MPKLLTKKEKENYSSNSNLTGARARFDGKRQGCVYNAQGDVVCGVPVGDMAAALNRAPDFQRPDRDPNNLGALASDEVHMRQPTVTFTYNPHICCRKTCSRVAPCTAVDADIQQPNTKCSACQKGLCNRMC